MLSYVNKIIKNFGNDHQNTNKMIHPNLIKIIHEYSIQNFDEIDFHNNEKIISNLKQSNIITINHIKMPNDNNNEECFIVGFKNTLIISNNQTSIEFFNSFLSINPSLLVCFLFDNKKSNKSNFSSNMKEFKIDKNFKIDIYNFNQAILKANYVERNLIKTWNDIISCLSSFLIGEAYLKMNKKITNRFQNDKTDSKSFGKNDFIELHCVGSGSLFITNLIYHIETGELFVVKKPNLNDHEIAKLKEREKSHYLQLKNPFIPNFHGFTYQDNLVIDFIKGKTLKNIDKNYLRDEEKITIIFQLMIALEYIHRNGFIYRDLKPDNVMIDENKTAILIDFDRMITNEKEKDNEDITKDFPINYAAPETNSGKFSSKSDVYSLGKLIYFIIKEKTPSEINIKNDSKFGQFTELEEMFKECINSNYQKRPTMSSLILDFYFIYCSSIKIDNFIDMYENNLMEMFNENIIKEMRRINYKERDDGLRILSIIYYEGQYISRNINKVILYLTNAARRNNIKAQFSLGVIYLDGRYFPRDINKSIYYYTLAADQNDIRAQHNLGLIYYEGKYVTRNINKALYYYELSAKQNSCLSQYDLALIYYQGKYVTRDINKAIYYFEKAAKQNDIKSQINLGTIYWEGKYVSINLDKAIHYFTLAANQGNAFAQYNLALIYEDNQNINKAIYYYSLSANQGYSYSQFNLGLIYDKGEYIDKDINKAIYYYTLAADNGDSKAQLHLGRIYSERPYLNINKAIYYLTLAANQNNVNAQYILGIIFIEDKIDIPKAIHYFSLASDQNLADAQYNLGIIYSSAKYANQDINKAIYYYSKAAKNKHLNALFNLAVIYSSGLFVPLDIQRAIYYFKLASDLGSKESQFCLGLIYSDNKHIPRDISQAIHFYTLASNKNMSSAQLNLGILYSEGKYVKQDINKGIHYFSLAANNNNPNAQYNLALVYLNHSNINIDVNKAIHYFTLASNQGHKHSQFKLGILYYQGYLVQRDIKKGLYLISLSSMNGFVPSHFALGYLFHHGECIDNDIEKSIHYYKEASSFNFEFAKNNLGIIYKNGIENKIKPNIGRSIEYFNEAINQKNDLLSMYNLSNIYIYKFPNDENIEKSIGFLVKTLKYNFSYSKKLLCLVLVKKYGCNIEMIQNKLQKFEDLSSEMKKLIIGTIIHKNYNNKAVFNKKYKKYEKKEFIYNHLFDVIPNEEERVVKSDSKIQSISKNFYEGFGHDLIN